MAKKKRPAVDPALVQRAKATAYLQTSPEAQTLTQLLRGAASDYAGQVAVEKGAARGVVSSANAAIPKVKSYFNQADQTRQASQAYVDRRLSGLSPIADDIRAGSASEAAGFMRRLGETRATTLGEFQSRKVDAKAGAAFAVRAARDQFRSDSGKIKDQILNLKRRKGVITTVALNDALDAEAQAAQARRTENRLWAGTKETQRHNRATENQAAANAAAKEIAAKKKHREKVAAAQQAGITKYLGGPRAAETQSSRNFKGSLSDVRGLIGDADRNGLSDHQIRANLLDGKNPSGKKYSRDQINAAFDLARKGYLSRPNIVALRRRGVRIPRAWKPPKARRVGPPGIPHTI